MMGGLSRQACAVGVVWVHGSRPPDAHFAVWIDRIENRDRVGAISRKERDDGVRRGSC